jgi:hypothetical protein
VVLIAVSRGEMGRTIGRELNFYMPRLRFLLDILRVRLLLEPEAAVFHSEFQHTVMSSSLLCGKKTNDVFDVTEPCGLLEVLPAQWMPKTPILYSRTFDLNYGLK